MTIRTPDLDLRDQGRKAPGATDRPSAAVRSLLLTSAAIALAIGAGLLIDPVGFHASNGITFEETASMMSEVRAPGAALLVLGVLMSIGAFVRSVTPQSMTIAAAVYLSYGLARLLSFGLDGLPAVGLVAAAGIELALGGACLATLVSRQRTRHALASRVSALEGGA